MIVITAFNCDFRPRRIGFHCSKHLLKPDDASKQLWTKSHFLKKAALELTTTDARARSELIDELNIKELWLAWTERRGDAQADALRPKAQLAKRVVEAASVVAACAAFLSCWL